MQHATNTSNRHANYKLLSQLQRNNVYRDYRIRILSNSNIRLRQLSSSTKSTYIKTKFCVKGSMVSKIPAPHLFNETIPNSVNGMEEYIPNQVINQQQNMVIIGQIWNEPIFKFSNPRGIIW